jgi:hypothetical protein
MASSPSLDDITRILDLIATPLALEVLDGLDRGRQPRASAPSGCDSAILQTALDALAMVGAITDKVGGDPKSREVTLTPAGERLLHALRVADEGSDIKYLFPSS